MLSIISALDTTSEGYKSSESYESYESYESTGSYESYEAITSESKNPPEKLGENNHIEYTWSRTNIQELILQLSFQLVRDRRSQQLNLEVKDRKILDALLQTIGQIGEQSAPPVSTGFIVDILDLIEEQSAPSDLIVDGLLHTIADIQEPPVLILPEFDGLLQTIADIREPVVPISDLDGLFNIISDIGEQPTPPVDTDFIVHILDDIREQTPPPKAPETDGILQTVATITELPSPPSDLDSILRTISDINETLVEKPDFDGVLRTIGDVQPVTTFKKIGRPNLFEIICTINQVRPTKKKKYLNLF